MDKMAIRKCPICGNSKSEVIHTQKFYNIAEYELPTEYDVASCKNCGLFMLM